MEAMRQKVFAWSAEKLFPNWPVIMSVILLTGVFVSALLVYFQSTAISGPFSTLQAYCQNLEAQNYPAAYNLLDATSRGQFSANDFALFAAYNGGKGRVSGCQVRSVEIMHEHNIATGSINFSYSNESTHTVDYTLNKQGSGWKLVDIVASSPGAVLSAYCQAIAAYDYHTAYLLWSKAIRASLSEADFTQKFTLASISNCKAAPAREHDATATSTVAYGDTSGATTFYTVQLINDDGLWLLNDQRQQ
jgi:hypothetical protein